MVNINYGLVEFLDLIGTMMWCIWRTFLYIPLGWASYLAGHIFLGYGARDAKTLTTAVAGCRREGFRNFCVYPEGAVMVPSLHKKSLAYAEKYVKLSLYDYAHRYHGRNAILYFFLCLWIVHVIRMKLPVLQHLLLPRVGAVSAAVRMLHTLEEQPKYFYDLTIGYPGIQNWIFKDPFTI